MNIADLNKAHDLAAQRTKLLAELHKLKAALPMTFDCHVYYHGYSLQNLCDIVRDTGLMQDRVAIAMIEALRQELEQGLDAVEVELETIGIVLHEALSPEVDAHGYATVPSDKHGNKL